MKTPSSIENVRRPNNEMQNDSNSGQEKRYVQRNSLDFFGGEESPYKALDDLMLEYPRWAFGCESLKT